VNSLKAYIKPTTMEHDDFDTELQEIDDIHDMEIVDDSEEDMILNNFLED